MIDTDKYEGHSEDEWVFDDEYIVMKNKTGNTRHVKVSQMNMNLMLDAPLLLAEVIRLREQNKLMVDYFRYMRDGGFTDADWRTVNEWIGDEEE